MKTFAQEMKDRLDDYERRANAVGGNMTQICKNTAIARATVVRWKERPPQSITKLDEIAAEVVRLEKAHAANKTAAS